MDAQGGLEQLHYIDLMSSVLLSIEAKGLPSDRADQLQLFLSLLRIASHPFRIVSFQLGKINQVCDCLKRVVDLVHDCTCKPARHCKLLTSLQRFLSLS